MNPVTFDRLRDALPDLYELRPMVNHAMATSTADPSRRWSGSGELATSGQRLVDVASIREAARALAEVESAHTHQLYHLIADAVIRLESEDGPGAAEALLEASALEEQRDRPDRAAAYADAAVRIGRGRRADELAGRALRRRARANRAAGRLAKAERDYQRAHDIGTAVGDVPGAAEAAIGAGNVLEEQGRWDAAEVWYRRALKCLSGTNGLLPARWHALLNLHVVLRSRGELDACLEPLEQAAAVADQLDDPSATQFMENARGQWRMAGGDYVRAEEHFRNGLSASTGARAEATIRLNLAEALFAAERRLEAAEEARRAERDTIMAGLPQKLPEVYRLLGRIAAAEENAEAFVFFEHALEIIDAQGLPDLETALTLQAYAEAEAGGGEHESAKDLYRRADDIYQELGISHRRSEWADRFGSDPLPDDEHKE